MAFEHAQWSPAMWFLLSSYATNSIPDLWLSMDSMQKLVAAPHAALFILFVFMCPSQLLLPAQHNTVVIVAHTLLSDRASFNSFPYNWHQMRS
jgi:hypothetical protein